MVMSFEKSESHLVILAAGVRVQEAVLNLAASAAISVLSVAARYSAILAFKGNTLVVAPNSAPMLQIVPIPFQDYTCL